MLLKRNQTRSNNHVEATHRVDSTAPQMVLRFS